jgi:hypothetical protein
VAALIDGNLTAELSQSELNTRAPSPGMYCLTHPEYNAGLDLRTEQRTARALIDKENLP